MPGFGGNAAWKYAVVAGGRATAALLYLAAFNTFVVQLLGLGVGWRAQAMPHVDSATWQRFEAGTEAVWLVAWLAFVLRWRLKLWYWRWVAWWAFFRLVGVVAYVAVWPDKRWLLAAFVNVVEPLSLVWQFWDWTSATGEDPLTGDEPRVDVRSPVAKAVTVAVVAAWQVGKDYMDFAMARPPAWRTEYVLAFYALAVAVPAVLAPQHPRLGRPLHLGWNTRNTVHDGHPKRRRPPMDAEQLLERIVV